MPPLTADPARISWPFAGSPGHTLGVELEVGVVRTATGELECAVPQILAGLDPDLFGSGPARIKREQFESTLEITTGICQTPAQARADLTAALEVLEPVLGDLDLSLIAAGAHPYSRWQQQSLTREDRYLQIIERFRWPLRQLTTYGLHVHVGVATGEHAIAAINALTGLLPHFLALSASSPFWQGADTGLASTRTRLWESVPSSGLPPRLKDWRDFEQLAGLLVGAGSITTSRDLWWDVRPSPLLGTVELRICDSVPTLTEMCALAAFAQAVVSYVCERLRPARNSPGIRAGRCGRTSGAPAGTASTRSWSTATACSNPWPRASGGGWSASGPTRAGWEAKPNSTAFWRSWTTRRATPGNATSLTTVAPCVTLWIC